jgi:hypothetical protein
MAPYGHKRCLGITQFFLEKALLSQRASRVKKNSGNTFVLMATLNPKTLALFHIFPYHVFSGTNGLLALF